MYQTTPQKTSTVAKKDAHEVGRRDGALVDFLGHEEEVVDVAVLNARDNVVDDGAGRRVNAGPVLHCEDPKVDPLLDDNVSELRLVVG